MKIYNKEKFQRPPHAVIFDMDNTLYDYEPAHQAGQKAVRNKMINLFNIEQKSFDKFFIEARDKVKKQLGETAAAHGRLLYFQNMLEKLEIGSQILYALDLEQTYWRAFLKKAVLFDNLKNLLEDFRLLSIPMSLITDLTAQIQFRKIIYFGLDHHFDYIVTSEEAGHDKPHIAPFKLILEKLNLPKDTLFWMIGDDPVRDIQGGVEHLKAVTLQKIHKGVCLGNPDASFGEYREMRTLVERLSKNP